MLEYLVIFGKGGAILWTFGQLLNIKGSPVDTLIHKCLLEERGGENSYTYKPPSGTHYTLKWTFHNGLDLVFVAAYQSMLTLPYVDDLLGAMRDDFARRYRPDTLAYPEFDAVYARLAKLAEKRELSAKMRTQPSRTGQSTALSQPRDGALAGALQSGSARAEPGAPAGLAGSAGSGAGEQAAGSLGRKALAGHSEPLRVEGQSSGGDEEDEEAAFDTSALARKFGRKTSSKRATPAKPAKPAASKTPASKGKQPRNWGGPEAKTPEDLDFSASRGGSEAALVTLDPTGTSAEASRMDAVTDVRYDEDDAEIERQLRATGDAPPSGLLAGFLSSLQTSVLGKDALSSEDLAAAVASMQKRLQERNVSSDVARALCDSVALALEGRSLASFTRVSAIVRGGFEDAITRILTPPRSLDVLAEIRAAKAKGKPYSIVFVGVNGVGKSTNLAKIAYWLRQQGLRVMIAACDTFRSGAVEQLKTHCNRLGVPLYDRGYDKDPTNVAAEAMRQAERDGIDVVLVDTAGRMQDNEPLMHALSTLINRNTPDLVLFVGEALVGNDGVNQLVKFNQRLADLSPLGREARLIDGIVVTKFDAIDDKVGAVLSMAYCSGAPIMFVGCGQTYVDLMRLDVKSVVKSLLK